ncbi:hypothetical protein B0H21DRAFT_884582 [Amylocystis lapponica]|nr:hypothetical protein B0H21DRAFT_884582 [Amylocystis lapponica]
MHFTTCFKHRSSRKRMSYDGSTRTSSLEWEERHSRCALSCISELRANQARLTAPIISDASESRWQTAGCASHASILVICKPEIHTNCVCCCAVEIQNSGARNVNKSGKRTYLRSKLRNARGESARSQPGLETSSRGVASMGGEIRAAPDIERRDGARRDVHAWACSRRDVDLQRVRELHVKHVSDGEEFLVAEPPRRRHVTVWDFVTMPCHTRTPDNPYTCLIQDPRKFDLRDANVTCRSPNFGGADQNSYMPVSPEIGGCGWTSDPRIPGRPGMGPGGGEAEHAQLDGG